MPMGNISWKQKLSNMKGTEPARQVLHGNFDTQINTTVDPPNTMNKSDLMATLHCLTISKYTTALCLKTVGDI